MFPKFSKIVLSRSFLKKGVLRFLKGSATRIQVFWSGSRPYAVVVVYRSCLPPRLYIKKCVLCLTVFQRIFIIRMFVQDGERTQKLWHMMPHITAAVCRHTTKHVIGSVVSNMKYILGNLFIDYVCLIKWKCPSQVVSSYQSWIMRPSFRIPNAGYLHFLSYGLRDFGIIYTDVLFKFIRLLSVRADLSLGFKLLR